MGSLRSKFDIGVPSPLWRLRRDWLYLVSDMYIALFSRFTTCGSWEGHNILDFIARTNETCGRNDPCGYAGTECGNLWLAHLLGIRLQPRIRNWKGLNLFRSNPDISYEHIDLLFTKRVDWDLIETMLPEMLRVAVRWGGKDQAIYSLEATGNVLQKTNCISLSESWVMLCEPFFCSNISRMSICAG